MPSNWLYIDANFPNFNGDESTEDKPSKKTVEEIAREVIAGKWGNGADRKNRLTAAGYDPQAVQSNVNQLLG